MNNRKIRTIKTDDERFPGFIAIDDFEDFSTKFKCGKRYLLSCVIRNTATGEYNKPYTLYVNEKALGVLDRDKPYIPNMIDYLLLSAALRNSSYRYNKKTGEIIKLKKKMKKRVIRAIHDGDCNYIGFDSFTNIEQRGLQNGKYSLMAKIEDCGVPLPMQEVYVDLNLPVLREDKPVPLTMKEYDLFGRILKANKYKINRKTGEIKKDGTRIY